MAISTLANLNAAFPGQRLIMEKIVLTASAGGVGWIWGSFWTSAGVPAPATYPAASLSWVIPTSATPGALPFTNPLTGNSYLGRAYGITNSTQQPIALYDRLAHTGAITPTAGTQALTTTPLTRPDALGGNVELWWEWITPSSSTPTSDFSCSYTNQDGTAGQTTQLLAGKTSSTVAHMQQFRLALGDTGVRSVESFTSTAAIGGTGMLVLLRRIAFIIMSTTSDTQDALKLGMPQIYNDACLALMTPSTALQSIIARGFIDIIQG